jgi:hypothetical protein
MNLAKTARLSIFFCPDLPQTASQRFSSNILFDRNLLTLIEQYVSFSLSVFATFKKTLKYLDPPTNGKGFPDVDPYDTLCKFTDSVCVHPITNHLWVTDRINRRLCVYQKLKESNTFVLIQCVACQGFPSCLCISYAGHVVVAECSSYAITVYETSTAASTAASSSRPFDEKSNVVRHFGENTIMAVGLAIHNTYQQIIIIEKKPARIAIYSMKGDFLRVVNTFIRNPNKVCLNEKDSILFVSERWYTSDKIHAIDMKTDLWLCTWETWKKFFVHNMVYTQENDKLFIVISHNCVFYIDCQNAFRYSLVIRHICDRLNCCDIAFHYGQKRLLMCAPYLSEAYLLI